MKKFFDENKIIIIKFVLLILLFPVIILVPSPIGFIPKDIGIAIVGYGGAIIGGFLTLYGVWWTIEDNNKNRKKELELQYYPVIRVDVVKRTSDIYQLCSEIYIKYNHKFFETNLYTPESSILKVTNVGRGEIENISFSGLECSLFECHSKELGNKFDLLDYFISSEGRFEFIPINGEIFLLLCTPRLKSDKKMKLEEGAYIKVCISMDITVKGIFCEKEQQYFLNFYMDIFLKNRVPCKIYDMSFQRVGDKDIELDEEVEG